MAGQGGLHTFDAREGVGLVLASQTLVNIRAGRGAGVPTDTSRPPAVLETGARGGSSETIFFMHYLGPLQNLGGADEICMTTTTSERVKTAQLLILGRACDRRRRGYYTSCLRSQAETQARFGQGNRPRSHPNFG